MPGYLELVLAAICYAVGIVAQTTAARRAERRSRLDLGLLARLATDRIYLFGFSAQVGGFVLAFLARADLPLYLVQAGASSSVGIAALIGAVGLGWRVRRAEGLALAVMAVGLVLLAAVSVPSKSGDLPLAAGLALAAALLVTLALAVPAARLTGPRGAIVMGVLAGVAFSVLAVASRPLASGPFLELPRSPLFWLMVLAAVLGQALLAAALQRGSTTATMATMDATTMLLSSVVGLAVLGDQTAAGQGPWVAVGLTLVVGGVLAMAAVVSPVPPGRVPIPHGPPNLTTTSPDVA